MVQGKFSLLLMVAVLTGGVQGQVLRKERTDCTNGRIDLAIILDSSGSIPEEDYFAVIQFLTSLTNRLDVDSGSTRMGLVRYSDNVVEQFGFDSFSTSSQVQSALLEVPYDYDSRESNTDLALMYVTDELFTTSRGDRPNVQNVILMFTDGGSTDKQAAFEAAQTARQNAHILVVGIGNWVDTYELQSLATDQYKHNLILVEDIDDLPDTLDAISNKLCNVINECDSNPCQNFGRCIDSIDMFYCQCIFNYAGVLCEYECALPANIAILLDSSASIGLDNFQSIVNFSKLLALNFPNSGEGQVSLMTFSDTHTIYTDFSEIMGVAYLMDAMTVPYLIGRNTLTADALEAARTEIFSTVTETGTPNIIILLTDGHPEDGSEAWLQSYANRLYGIHTVVIGLPTNIGIDEASLRSIASWPEESNVWKLNSFDEIDSVLTDLRKGICAEVEQCSEDLCQNGGTCVNSIRSSYCYCTDDTTGQNCERRCSGFTDIAFVIDISGSTMQEHMDKVKKEIAVIMENLEIWNGKTRVAVVTFAETATPVVQLKSFSTIGDNIEAVQRVQFAGGKTNIAAALRTVREVFSESGNRDNVQDIAILFSDGQPTLEVSSTMDEIIATKLAGIEIITMSVGSHINLPMLKAIASEPAERNVMAAENYFSLNTMTSGVLAATCNDNNECDRADCGSGRCVDQYGGYRCECSSGTTGKHCERRCNRQLDIAVAMDVSGSSNNDNYTTEFYRELMYGFNIASNGVRSSLVLFSDVAEVRYHFDSYTNPQDMITASVVAQRRGGTNLADTLSTIRTDVFQSNHGDRDNSPDVLIMLIDGPSSVNRNQSVPQAEQLKDAEVAIFVVVIGDYIDEAEVGGLASENSPNYVYKVRDDESFNEEVDRFLSSFCG